MPETNGSDRALPEMPESPQGVGTLTCEQVEAGDYEARYLQHRLDEASQAAYEAHYFGCERCWASLRRATAVRAAFASGGRSRRMRWAVWALPAAAALVVVLFQPFADRAGDRTTPLPAQRGAASALRMRATATTDSVRASWPAQAGADAYRMRGFTSDGGLVWTVETTDTTIVAARAGARLVDVAALDRLRAVIGQSSLVTLDPP
jgi:hypothetical protein